MRAYKKGQIAIFRATIHDDTWHCGGDPAIGLVNPDALTFQSEPGTLAADGNTWTGSGSPSSPVTWDGTNETPALGVIGLVSLGTLEVWVDTSDIDTPNLAGKWEATGSVQAPGWEIVLLNQPPF